MQLKEKPKKPEERLKELNYTPEREKTNVREYLKGLPEERREEFEDFCNVLVKGFSETPEDYIKKNYFEKIKEFGIYKEREKIKKEIKEIEENIKKAEDRKRELEKQLTSPALTPGERQDIDREIGELNAQLNNLKDELDDKKEKRVLCDQNIEQLENYINNLSFNIAKKLVEKKYIKIQSITEKDVKNAIKAIIGGNLDNFISQNLGFLEDKEKDAIRGIIVNLPKKDVELNKFFDDQNNYKEKLFDIPTLDEKEKESLALLVDANIKKRYEVGDWESALDFVDDKALASGINKKLDYLFITIPENEFVNMSDEEKGKVMDYFARLSSLGGLDYCLDLARRPGSSPNFAKELALEIWKKIQHFKEVNPENADRMIKDLEKNLNLLIEQIEAEITPVSEDEILRYYELHQKTDKDTKESEEFDGLERRLTRNLTEEEMRQMIDEMNKAEDKVKDRIQKEIDNLNNQLKQLEDVEIKDLTNQILLAQKGSQTEKELRKKLDDKYKQIRKLVKQRDAWEEKLNDPKEIRKEAEKERRKIAKKYAKIIEDRIKQKSPEELNTILGKLKDIQEKIREAEKEPEKEEKASKLKEILKDVGALLGTILATGFLAWSALFAFYLPLYLIDKMEATISKGFK
jgi:DNA repair exonuclease SbcCD ATPase subunit